MNDFSFDILSRHAAAGLSRFAALMALGIPGVANPITTEARKQSAGKKARKKRQKQVAPCFTAFSAECLGDPTCEAKIQRCCAFMGTCDVTGWITCLTGP